MPSPESPPEENEEAAAFATFDNPGDPEPPQDQPPPKGGETPSQTSPRNAPQAPPPSHGETATSSSTGSSEPSVTLADVQDAIGDLGAGLFAGLTQLVNGVARKRTRRPTDRWLATEEEARAFGELAEQYLVSKVPENLTEGDGAALAVGGLIFAGYLVRNLLRAGDVDAVAGDAPGRRAPDAPPPAPPPPPPARPAAPPQVPVQAVPTRPAEPGPITAISPEL